MTIKKKIKMQKNLTKKGELDCQKFSVKIIQKKKSEIYLAFV